MQNKTIEEIQEKYDLELDKIVEEIKDKKSKLVLLQFPDGLKPYATVVVDYLESKLAPKGVRQGGASTSSRPQTSDFGGKFLIWLGSCFGACDIPVGIEKLKIDLVVQFGHNEVLPSS